MCAAYFFAMKKKRDLPSKICAACARPFSWRRKWARDWEAVKYCSERCKRAGRVRRPARP
ncbi:DUF2256 domain-containing protein [Tepidicaulis marinus]|uniref:DUF2256 domain-containing protein n=1 Tax=Tepidicaulis marinus TaxID=1333998 RepID=UPI0005EF397E